MINNPIFCVLEWAGMAFRQGQPKGAPCAPLMLMFISKLTMCFYVTRLKTSRQPISTMITSSDISIFSFFSQ
jgi:hypothetical protein